MNVNAKALELKSKIMDSVQMWSDGLIDSFFEAHHLPKIAVKYIKRGRDNFIAQQDEAITNKINSALLFVTDKDGNYDLGMLSDDLISLLRDMPELRSISVLPALWERELYAYTYPKFLLCQIFLAT